jgi:hypothetical protein
MLFAQGTNLFSLFFLFAQYYYHHHSIVTTREKLQLEEWWKKVHLYFRFYQCILKRSSEFNFIKKLPHPHCDANMISL